MSRPVENGLDDFSPLESNPRATLPDSSTKFALEAQTELKSQTEMKAQPEKAARVTGEWRPAINVDERGCVAYSHWAVEIREGKRYTVEKGDTLRDVARRSLGVTGNPDATSKEIAAEMKRIAALNPEVFPNAKKQFSALPKGHTLRLAAPEEMDKAEKAIQAGSEFGRKSAKLDDDNRKGVVSKDADCPEAKRERVQKRGFVKAENCDKYEMMDESAVIVRPGADVVLNSGSRAFVFGGKVDARAGSRVIYTGGDLNADPEARVKFVTANSITESHNPNYPNVRIQSEIKTQFADLRANNAPKEFEAP